MKKSLKVTVLATAIAAILPLQGNAAGLGGIQVFSALGQPLRAEIELHATPDELDGMSASVPSPEAFSRANLEYSPLMGDLEMNIERRGNRSVIRLSSSRVVNEPFIDVLVQLRWSAGSLLREYTFLLDPADTQPARAAVSSPARAAAAARPGTAPATATAGQHVVRRGETLHRIAQEYLPPGVALDQMLIGLLRENPDAFAGGNINRLRAGATLKIPDHATVTAVSADEARRSVLAQAAEFDAYRNRVAAAVTSRAPASAPQASRESAGRIEPRVEEVVRDAAPADQLQVSRAPAQPSAATGGPEQSNSSEVVAEDDVVSLRREMAEMRARLVELEQAVADKQSIIDIRDSVIASMQGQQPSSEAPAAVTQPAEDAAVKPVPPAEKPVRRAPPPPPEPGLLENPLVLAAGALLAGLLALLGIRIARRRRTEQNFDSLAPMADEPQEPLSVVSQPGGESVDTDSNTSVMDTDFSQTGLSAIDADEGVDPVAEADVYLAYGRDAQAEEILLDALKVDASRHAIYLKLLEVYVQRGDRRQFEVIATDLYSRTGGEGGDWQKAAAMGRKLDPENPLYGDSGAITSSSAITGAVVVAAAGSVAARELEDTQLGLDQSELELPELDDAPPLQADGIALASLEPEGLDFDLDVDLPAPASDAAESETIDHDENLLSFDLDLGEPPSAQEPTPVAQKGEGDATSMTAAQVPAVEEETVMDLERTEFDPNLLDFDLDLSPPAPAEADAAEALDLASIDLELAPEAPPAVPEQSAPVTADEAEAAAVPRFDAQDVQREMETKLELARAYDEMGDREGARELLEEVVKDGSAEQREEAERMLERLA
jgi:pilus assembly protein FimV